MGASAGDPHRPESWFWPWSVDVMRWALVATRYVGSYLPLVGNEPSELRQQVTRRQDADVLGVKIEQVRVARDE